MAEIINSGLTAQGQTLYAATQIGENVTFTRVALGDGNFSGNIEDMTDMVAELDSLEIGRAESIDNQLSISVVFDNRWVQEPFQMTERGIFARGEDGVEVLYSYVYHGDTAGTIPPWSNLPIENIMTFEIPIGNVANVTALISTSVYATIGDLQALENEVNHSIDMVYMNLDDIKSSDSVQLTSGFSEGWKNNYGGIKLLRNGNLIVGTVDLIATIDPNKDVFESVILTLEVFGDLRPTQDIGEPEAAIVSSVFAAHTTQDAGQIPLFFQWLDFGDGISLCAQEIRSAADNYIIAGDYYISGSFMYIKPFVQGIVVPPLNED